MKPPNTKVADFLKKFKIQGKSILCAVSGGADSVCLIHILQRLSHEFNLKLFVAHVDHSLRERAGEKEYCFVRDICDAYNIPFEFKKLSGKSLGDSGIEEWAREERYHFFKEIKKKYSIDYIATGHTMDDQAETLFMRIGRGSGLKALYGIKSFREDGVIRPLLDISKDEIIQHLMAEKLSWCEDYTNQENIYKRNKIRNDIFPFIENVYPDFKKRLYYLSQQVSDLQEIIDPPVSLWCISHIGEHDNKEFKISKPLDLNNRFIASEGMANIFREYSISAERVHIEEFLDNSNRTSGEFLLPGGWKYYPGNEAVHVTCKNSIDEIVDLCTLKVPGSTLVAGRWMVTTSLMPANNLKTFTFPDKMTVVVAKEKISSLAIRTVRNDDVFIPYGSNSYKSVLKYLKKHGLNEHERSQNLVLCSNESDIVWVVGQCINDDFKVGKTTSDLIKIEVQLS